MSIDENVKNVKWLANKLNSDGRVMNRKGSYPTIHIHVQENELLKAIGILTTGRASVTVTSLENDYRVSLKGKHARDWLDLTNPYLK